MARVALTFDGDPRGAVAAVRQVARANADLKNGVKSGVTQAVEAQAKERASLRQIAAEFRATAKASKKGSDEQISATRLAIEAERQLGTETRHQTGFLGIFRKETSHTTGEVSKLERGALAGSGAMKHFGRNVAYASGAFLGAQGIIAVAKQTIDAGADLQTQQIRTDQVFRGSATIVKTWAEASVAAMHLTSSESLKLADDIGTVLHALGLGPKLAATYSTSLAKVAVNLAAVKGADPTDVVTAINAALRGRGLTLANYGVKLDNVRLKEEALRLGLVKGVETSGKAREADLALAIARGKLADAEHRFGPGTTQVASAQLAVAKAQDAVRKAIAGTVPPLTAAQKAQASYSLILKQAGFASDGFTKQSKTLKGEEALLHAETGQLEEEVGTALLPTMTKAIGSAARWASGLNKGGKAAADVQGFVQALVGTFKAAKAIIETVDKVTGGFKQTLELLLGLKVAITLSRWTAALTALAGSETAAAGAAGANAEVSKLRGSLKLLQGFAAKPIQIFIAYSILRKIFPKSNADLSDNPTSFGDLLPVYKDGKWVDPTTGQPEVDQAYWQNRWSQSHKTKPKQGQDINSSGAKAGTATEPILSHASALGEGSGGVYKTGGGHSGIAKPGTMLDCSGYVYQVFTQSGFKGFPGTSETQWATHSGPNWTSQKINPSETSPGDVVFMVGSPEYPSPGHVGICINGHGPDALIMQYYSSGQPADTIKLDDVRDLVGVKRFYLAKKADKGSKTPTSPGSSTAPTTPKKTSTTPTVPLKVGTATSISKAAKIATTLPASVKSALGRAKGTDAIADDIKADEEAISVLTARLKKTTDKDVRAALTTAIGAYQASLNAAKKKLEAQATKLPAGVRSALGRAKGTESLLDDIKADQEAIAYLTGELRKTTDKDVKASLNAAIGTYEKSLNAAKKKLASARATERSVASQYATAKPIVAQAFAQGLIPAKDEAKLQRQERDLDRLIRKALKDGVVTPAEAAKISRSWKAMSKGISDAEQAVADRTHTVFQRQWDGVTNQITRGIDEAWQITVRDFGRQTDAGVQSIQDQASTALRAMQERFQRDMRVFDAETQRGLDKISAKYEAPTPTEALIAQMTAAHDAQAAADQLAADQAAGDTKAVAEDLYQERLAALQKIADAERAAATDQEKKAQDAYQAQRDDLRQALDDRETDLETALQRQYDAEVQAYQDGRDAQLQALQDRHDDQVTALNQDLEDWGTWIEEKQRSYAAFLTWLAANPESAALGGQYPSDWGGTGIHDIGATSKISAIIDLLNKQRASGGGVTGGKMPAFALGGQIPGQYVGVRDSVVARVTPGETVIDRTLTEALKRSLVRGGGHGGPTIGPVYVLGTTRREVQRALKQMVDSAPTTPGYESGRG